MTVDLPHPLYRSNRLSMVSPPRGPPEHKIGPGAVRGCQSKLAAVGVVGL